MDDSTATTRGSGLSTLLLAIIAGLIAFQTFRAEPRFEYHFGTFGDADETGNTLHKQINALADDGWRFAKADIVSWGTEDNRPTEVRAILRRTR